MRPQSIVTFERLYLASFVVGLVSTAQNWGERAAMLAGNPATANLGWIAPASTVVGVLIALSLWYLVAHRASVVAKWVVVVFAVWAAVLLCVLGYGLIVGRGQAPLLLVGVVQNILYIAAAAMLFRADARTWLGEGSVAESAA